MSQSVTTQTEKKGKLSVHIVEQHNDVLPFIHRAIASRRIPFNNIKMLHFDSHPDLLLPPKLKADTIFQPHVLYEQLSIENWLLPLTYAKHIDHVIWIKPPWAYQIKNLKDNFKIGKCILSGYVRLTCKENYFLTDGLFQSSNNLENTSNVDLMVSNLIPDKWGELELGALHSTVEIPAFSRAALEHDLQDVLTDKAYILDIDLDFFSTANPFKDILKPEEETALRNLYQYAKLKDFSDEGVTLFTKQRFHQLNKLQSLFSSLEAKWVANNSNPCKENIEDLLLTELTNIDCSNFHLVNSYLEDFTVLIKAVLKENDAEILSFDQLHNFGCTLDDTELPHHISTEPQIAALLDSFTALIENLPKPSIVTISRSSYDDYCPKHQVDKCQRNVLSILERLYGPLNITYDI